MKYVIVQTTYSPQKEMVVELYLMPIDAYFSSEWPHTTLLSDAMVWDTFEEVKHYLSAEKIDDHKIVEVEDKKLFEARLARE